MTSEMDGRKPPSDPADEYDALVAAMRALMPRTNLEVEEEISTGPDPVGRCTVKPVRGGMPDVPIVRHVGFGACPPGIACGCPPVDVRLAQEKLVGIRARGSSQPAKTMPRADLRKMDESTGTTMGIAKQELGEDDGLTLPALPKMDELADLAPTSTRPMQADVHLACKADHERMRVEQSKLHTRTIRAEHKLARALAEIERLKAQLSEQPKRTRKAK
jgi:hypothetical protein